jgi:hypothetical protein
VEGSLLLVGQFYVLIGHIEHVGPKRELRAALDRLPRVTWHASRDNALSWVHKRAVSSKRIGTGVATTAR